ncbi:MAG TPA: rRNA adenine N-6-methyltransferase family protein [Steroidobacteraceae bacterium]|nr:rRNA adenine N-6-methyltransferase family protein [Steroidobacteraceae bacterium]
MTRDEAIPSSSRSKLTELLLFAGNFVRHPHMLGSIIPSSRFLVNQVLEPVDWERARVIVEYGPGIGTFTGEILRRMRSDARLIVIETNEDFVQFLQDSLADPRLHVVHDSAAEVRSVLQRHGLSAAHYIISGIPLGSMPQPVRADIVEKTRAALEPGGAFLVYQFTPRVLPTLRRSFGEVRRGFQLCNVPPAQLFVCNRQRTEAATDTNCAGIG